MKILKTCTSRHTWISLVEDFRAKTSALAERVKELREKDPVYGKRCVVLYGKLDLNTSSLKTVQLSLFEDLKSCYATLPREGMMQNGSVYQTVNSASTTRERESILLPTPIKSSDKRGGFKDGEKLKVYLSKYQKNTVDILSLKGFTKCQIVNISESMMGFPIGVTELDQ